MNTGTLRRSSIRLVFFCLLAAVLVLMHPSATAAFVVLDTSTTGEKATTGGKTGAGARPRRDSLPPRAVAPRAPSVGASSLSGSDRSRAEKPRYGTVLFLSADNMLVYSQLGVLKALEEFGIHVDLILAESKSVALGACWALGYPAWRIEQMLLEKPLEYFVRPFPGLPTLSESFAPEGPDSPQWEILLGTQSLQATQLTWRADPGASAGEFLHLSWMVAKLTHDGPSGPVEDMAEAPRRLAVQVSNLAAERPEVLVQGNLQAVLKGSLLPRDVVRRRPQLWPYASGSLLTGQAILADRLPFTFDHLILLQPGRNLRPPPLEAAPNPWLDSLSGRFRPRADALPINSEAKVIRVEILPDAGFHGESADRQAWIELGYTSALRSMDALLATVGKEKSPDTVSRAALGTGLATPAGADGTTQAGAPKGAGPPNETSAPKGSASPRKAVPLALDQASINPLASGGRQFLIDLIDRTGGDDTTGEGSIAAIIHSGFYSQLDLEWTGEAPAHAPDLILDAKDQSRLLLRGGFNLAFTGETLPRRGPELFAGLAWHEPFHIPFRAEAGALLGGHRPGVGGRFLISPMKPFPIEIGVSRLYQDIAYPDPPEATLASLGAVPMSLRRDLSLVFLKLLPFRPLEMKSSISRHELESRPGGTLGLSNRETALSTDFQQDIHLGLGSPARSGSRPLAASITYRCLNPVDLFGEVGEIRSTLESRLRFSLGDFRLIDQYYWSDQRTDFVSVFDLYKAGQVDAFSFQDEFAAGFLRSVHFQNLKLQYAPVFGRAGFLLTLGAYGHYGPSPLYPKQGAYWEAMAAYATPLGPLRAGAGAQAGEKPVLFLRIGSTLDLERLLDGSESPSP